MHLKPKYMWVFLTILFFWLAPCYNFLVSGKAMPRSTDLTEDSARELPRHKRSHKRLKRARISAIKEDFLAKMGLTRIPDVSRANVSQEDLRQTLRLYQESLISSQDKTHVLFDDSEFTAKRLHSFRVADCFSEEDCYMEHHAEGYLLRLPVELPDPKEVRKETYVHSSTLKLFKYDTRPENIRDNLNVDRTVRISIYQVVKNTTSNSTLRRLVDSKMVSLDSIGWETFEVTTVVSRWKHEQFSNHGLLIICDSQPLKEVIDFMPQIKELNADSFNVNYLPVLEVQTQDHHIIRRQKRSAPETYDCRKGDGESRCCRYPLEIRFKDIGWDSWILAPDGFKAYFCEGSCPHSYKMGHNFAGAQSLMHIFNPAAAPEPCCSASELSPIRIAHFDENGQAIVSEYDDMVVQGCKCS